jgi:hypothetical protein
MWPTKIDATARALYNTYSPVRGATPTTLLTGLSSVTMARWFGYLAKEDPVPATTSGEAMKTFAEALGDRIEKKVAEAGRRR